jgi:hypothetical protein
MINFHEVACRLREITNLSMIYLIGAVEILHNVGRREDVKICINGEIFRCARDLGVQNKLINANEWCPPQTPNLSIHFADELMYPMTNCQPSTEFGIRTDSVHSRYLKDELWPMRAMCPGQLELIIHVG